MAVCKGCEKRYIGCHSECDDYIKERQELDKKNAEIRKQKESRMSLNYRKNMYEGATKHLKHKKGD